MPVSRGAAGRVPACGWMGSGAVELRFDTSLWTRIAETLRNLAGMPDYERHIEHLRRCHPDRPIPSERQYYEEFLKARYHDGPTRCC
jgi:uncharacterized short protein YbdD (DUF466 family)